MGYERINLLGGSYGTTAALYYLRQYPQRVRSVVIEGVAPPEFKLPLPFARGAQIAMDRIMERCAADETCSRAFPNLKAKFDEILARLDKGPATFEVVNPVTNRPQKVTMSRGAFTERVRMLLYYTQFARVFPLIINRAHEGDFTLFARAAHSVTRLIGRQVAAGMYFSVTCSEELPFITEQEIARETAGTFIGDYRVRVHIRACGEWPRANVPPNTSEPVKSDVPVLIIAGDIDPSTPLKYAQAAASSLTGSRLLVIRDGLHDYGGSCLDNIIAEFIAKGSATGLDSRCVDAARPQGFATELPNDF
jgi:pimeloyl-ACP methyl ester carboxylesterase